MSKEEKRERKELSKLFHEPGEDIDAKIAASIMAYNFAIMTLGQDAPVVAISAIGVAVLLFKKANLDPSKKEELLNKALQYTLKSLDIRKKLDDSAALSQSHEVLACILNGLKSYEDALSNINKAIRILKIDDKFNKKKLLELELHEYEFTHCRHNGFLNREQVLEFEKMKEIIQNYHNCGNCQKENCKSKCAGCELVYYCSPECQRLNWKEHKKECRK
jgi:tetratricopeptide (TPR) repeat protein